MKQLLGAILIFASSSSAFAHCGLAYFSTVEKAENAFKELYRQNSESISQKGESIFNTVKITVVPKDVVGRCGTHKRAYVIEVDGKPSDLGDVANPYR